MSSYLLTCGSSSKFLTSCS